MALGRWLRAAPPYALAAAIALMVLAAIDFSLRKAPKPYALFELSCLAAGLGAAFGLGWQLAFALVARLPRKAQLALWALAASAGGASLAHALGAFARIGSRHHQQALLVLGVASGGALLSAGLLAALQPTRSGPGMIFRSSRVVRAALGLALAAASASLFIADKRFFVGLYPVAHEALRLVCLGTAMVALVLLPSGGVLSRATVPGLVLVAALAAVPIVVEHRSGHTPVALTARPWAADVLRLAQAALDFDRDGYSALLGGGDCDDANASVHPTAREIPGNGRDDNCVLGDRLIAPPRIDVIEPARGGSPYDVVFVTIDTLRPDHLGAYDPKRYGAAARNTSPNIDRLAKNAYVFRNAFSTGGWTALALSSAMRGLYPRRLHWTPYFETSGFRLVSEAQAAALQPPERLMQFFPMPAEDPHVTLATLLKRRGMRTIAVVDDGYSTMLGRGGGLDLGFDEYVPMPNPERSGDEATITRALRSLAKVPADQRFFLWVHLFGPHSPNEAHAEVPSYGNSLADGYDHEIRYADLQLGRLLAELEKRKSPAVIVLAGDHGELFADDNRFHGFSLDEDVMRIPLIIRVPGARGRAVRSTATLADVMPTVLALTRTPGPSALDGIDLTASFSREPGGERIVLADCWRYLADRQLVMDATGATDGRRFFFYDRISGAATRSSKGSRSGQALKRSEALTDALGRTVLGYLEEVAALPR